MEAILRYDSSFDTRAEQWLKTNLPIFKKQSSQSIRQFQKSLYKDIIKLNIEAVEIEDEQLESKVLGPLYQKLYIMLHIMLVTKEYSHKKPFDAHLDQLFKLIDEVCCAFDDYSSSLRSEEIRKLAAKL